MKKQKIPKRSSIFEPIASLDYKTMSLKLNKKRFKKKFEDGTRITSFEIKRIDNKLYFVRWGHDRKGNCRIWRTKIKITPEGNAIFMRGSTTVTCVGVDCEWCNLSNGVCLCERSAPLKNGWCNQVVTRPKKLADFGVFRAR